MYTHTWREGESARGKYSSASSYYGEANKNKLIKNKRPVPRYIGSCTKIERESRTPEAGCRINSLMIVWYNCQRDRVKEQMRYIWWLNYIYSGQVFLLNYSQLMIWWWESIDLMRLNRDSSIVGNDVFKYL